MALKMTSKDGFYGWTNLAVLFFFNAALTPMLMAFSFFLPFWVKEFEWSRGLASGAQTVSIILSGAASPMVAIFIMKKGSKKAILIGNSMGIAGLVLLAFQQYIWQLYLGIGVLLGLGVALGGMLAMQTVVNNWFIVKRPVALSISTASLGFSGVIVNPAMMLLIDWVGWRNTYLILAATALLFCIILPGLLLKNRPEDLGQVPDGPVSQKTDEAKSNSPFNKHLYKTPVEFTAREALRTRTMWLLVAYGALQFFVMMSIMAHQITYLFDLGLSSTKAGMIGGILSAVMGVSQLGIGFLGLRFRMHSLAVASMLIGLIGFGILLFANSLPLIIAYAIIYGMSLGIQSVAMGNLFPDYFGRTEFPKIMGYTMPITTLVSSLGAPITGYIRDISGSYLPAFKVLLVLLAISFFCIVFAKPPKHPSLKSGESEAMA